MIFKIAVGVCFGILMFLLAIILFSSIVIFGSILMEKISRFINKLKYYKK